MKPLMFGNLKRDLRRILLVPGLAGVLISGILLSACESVPVKASVLPDLFKETSRRPRPSRYSEQRRVRKVLRSMTLEQKISQRFITWIRGTEMSDEIRHLVRQGAAGIILYPWNIESPGQVRELTSAAQEAARENSPPIELFISVDQEGGRVAAFRFREVTLFAPPFYWGRYRDPRYITAAAYITNMEIKALGCNMNLAPVLDLYEEADSTIIGDRSMGADPELVGLLGIHYLQGAFQAGVIPVIKHFPGHGGSTVDSHGWLPVVDLPEGVLMERDFKPFRMVIAAGAEALMTAHILLPRIDPDFPVSLSRLILRDILRKRFRFKGVVISDGLAMGALSKNFGLPETLKLMFQAGLDLILVHSQYELAELKDEVLRLHGTGEISEALIDEGVERILRLKLRYGLLPP